MPATPSMSLMTWMRTAADYSAPVETGLARKRVLVTGGAGGIGSACVRAFAAEGADVVIHYNTSRERAEELASEVGGVAVQADLTDEAQIDALFAAAGDLPGCAAVA